MVLRSATSAILFYGEAIRSEEIQASALGIRRMLGPIEVSGRRRRSAVREHLLGLHFHIPAPPLGGYSLVIQYVPIGKAIPAILFFHLVRILTLLWLIFFPTVMNFTVGAISAPAKGPPRKCASATAVVESSSRSPCRLRLFEVSLLDISFTTCTAKRGGPPETL